MRYEEIRRTFAFACTLSRYRSREPKKSYPVPLPMTEGTSKKRFDHPSTPRLGLTEPFVQDNVSASKARVLRGLHGDVRMAKLVQVLRGSAFDVIVDLRKESPSYMQWIGVCRSKPLRTPSSTSRRAACTDSSPSKTIRCLTYKQSAEYDPATEIGIAWNDPDLAIAWPLGRSRPDPEREGCGQSDPATAGPPVTKR